jgi:hypothetical protein
MRWKPVAICALFVVGGMAVHRNWDAISATLGLESIAPGMLRAVDLAKSANTLDRYRSNYAVIQARVRDGAGRIEAGDWQGSKRTDRLYLVTFPFTENGEPDGYWFEVDIGSLEVRNIRGDQKLEVLYGVPPAPR